MPETYYTLAMWKVKPEHRGEFVEAWKALSDIFARLAHKPISGTLVQSVNDPNLFYSFGPWKNREDIDAMRSDPASQEGIRNIMSLCVEATPGTYSLVADVRL